MCCFLCCCCALSLTGTNNSLFHWLAWCWKNEKSSLLLFSILPHLAIAISKCDAVLFFFFFFKYRFIHSERVILRCRCRRHRHRHQMNSSMARNRKLNRFIVKPKPHTHTKAKWKRNNRLNLAWIKYCVFCMRTISCAVPNFFSRYLQWL